MKQDYARACCGAWYYRHVQDLLRVDLPISE